MTQIDRPDEVREGEELDEESLEAWLRANVDDFDGPIELQQFRSGHSNLTYSVSDGRGTEYVLRRPPIGAHVDSGHDMSREWRVLTALEGVYDKVPRPIARCEDADVVGAPFYLMERVRGVVLRGNDPEVEGLDEPTMEALSETFVQEFADIHAVDWREAGLEDFGRPEGYLERQIEVWIERYRKSQTDEIEGMETAGEWLREEMPDDPGRAALIHNDFRYDNFVLDPDDLTSVVAVLDWEMATVGDPLMDLGTSLAYWFRPGDPDILRALDLSPTTRPGNFSRRELVDRYEAVTGRDCSNILFHYVYGLYKVAVIIQQIYYRWDEGMTDDPRFEMFIHAVRAFADAAETAIGEESIEPY
ncbi:MAG: phosphotransferase family protein [Bradymonadaceae bacterium]